MRINTICVNIKLEQEINDSLLADEYKVMGELLLSYPRLKEKTDKVDVYNYYTNELKDEYLQK